MKHCLSITLVLLILMSCKSTSELQTSVPTKINSHSISVSNKDELYSAIARAEPGDNIVFANGIWENVEIELIRSGTKEKAISLSAETPGRVLIQGQSDLKLGADYLVVEGLYFLNGYSPSRSVIHFEVDGVVANHCRVTNCVIENYNKPQRNLQDLWVLMKGKNNQLDHCYLAGKSNRGPTVRVDLKGNQNINNHHKIIHNHFGPRPPKGGPSAETIQIGTSHTSMCPSYTLVAHNLFDRCNGEVEVISSKTNFNEFRNNVFYKSEGSLVTRHGNYCTVDANYFIGDESDKIGGVRLIGTGHTVTNNYFYNLRGQAFRSPLAVMNGIPKSPLNRYIQVTDVTVAHNTYVNCSQPLQFGVGSNVSEKDVLPASEIRSARPIRTVVANNLIYNSRGDKMPVVAHDELDGITFKSNIINNQDVNFEKLEGLKEASFDLKEISEDIWVPSEDLPHQEVYIGYGFEEFDKDLFGNSRKNKNTVGAMTSQPTTAPPILDRSEYGTNWYKAKKKETEEKPNESYTPIELKPDVEGGTSDLTIPEYTISAPIKVDRPMTFSASPYSKVTFIYDGPPGTPMFELHPKGELTIIGIELQGNGSQHAFAPLKENMSSLYNLKVENCVLEDFDYILKAYKYSFSEQITFTNSTFRNCKNGLELSEEIEDKGEYNAENIIIDNCNFENIDANVIDYYRGGYDESTVGGNLKITNSTFTNCGANEKNGILLNTYGIINVDISDNTFKNNKVQKVALLWGAKNNSHSNNTLTNSGEIVVEENLKLKTFY